MPHSLRADARENRDRILGAARDLFAERGLDVGMREVARRAEVGPATLYRRFPTRQALVDASFSVELGTCRRIVEDGAADDDPWRGLVSILHALMVTGLRNRGFVDAYLAANPGTDAFAEHRRELLDVLDGLIDRARAAGVLRPDADTGDLVLVLLAARGLTALPQPAHDAAARRFATVVIDGLRADAAGS